MNTEALQKLPPQAFVENRNPDGSPLIAGTDANVLCIRRGERGAYPMKTDIPAEEWNRRHKVTPAQREAMLAGSVFGWDAIAADPDAYDAEGVLLPRIAEEMRPGYSERSPLFSPSMSAAPKYVVYIQAGDPYGRNFVANFEVEGVTVRGRDRDDVTTRADCLAAFLSR